MNASAQTLFDVLTDYRSYPRFSPSVVNMTVVKKDEEGAEFVAGMKSKVGKQAHAFDRYKRGRDLAVERTYDGIEGSSTWTAYPVNESSSTFTLDGTIGMSWLRGLMIKPFLKRMASSMDFKPFIEEAERRAKQAV